MSQFFSDRVSQHPKLVRELYCYFSKILVFLVVSRAVFQSGAKLSMSHRGGYHYNLWKTFCLPEGNPEAMFGCLWKFLVPKDYALLGSHAFSFSENTDKLYKRYRLGFFIVMDPKNCVHERDFYVFSSRFFIIVKKIRRNGYFLALVGILLRFALTALTCLERIYRVCSHGKK